MTFHQWWSDQLDQANGQIFILSKKLDIALQTLKANTEGCQLGGIASLEAVRSRKALKRIEDIDINGPSPDLDPIDETGTKTE